jgi:magnesium and cobalt transporter
MTPRTDIVCASDQENIRQVAELIIATGHSRIPLYSDNRDNIIGIVHAKDLLEHMLDPAEQERPATGIMRDPFFVPETKNVLHLLQEFRARKNHLAVILDEYGGTAGLVSIEDVLEQIVGDIEDEHDVPREDEIRLQPDGSYLINGRAYLEELDEAFGIRIESDEVDTLGGYLTHLAGRVPQQGEEFVLPDAAGETGRAVFSIIKSDAKQIYSVRLVQSGANAAVPASQTKADNGSSGFSASLAGPGPTNAPPGVKG